MNSALQLLTNFFYLSNYFTPLTLNHSDEIPKRRSFQDIGKTYRTICDGIMGEASALLMWEAGKDSAVNKPFVQYDETDWVFMKRMLSNLGQPVQTSVLSDKPHCYAKWRNSNY